MSMAKHLLKFPASPKFEPEAPPNFSVIRVGTTRLILDLRGPELKFRDDVPEAIPIETGRKRSE